MARPIIWHRSVYHCDASGFYTIPLRMYKSIHVIHICLVFYYFTYTQYALFTVRGIPTQNEARWACINDAMALRCFCVAGVCLRFALFVKQTFLFIVFPWIKLQEESGYSKAVVVFLYCKRFAGKIDVDSSRNRIDASQ